MVQGNSIQREKYICQVSHKVRSTCTCTGRARDWRAAQGNNYDVLYLYSRTLPSSASLEEALGNELYIWRVSCVVCRVSCVVCRTRLLKPDTDLYPIGQNEFEPKLPDFIAKEGGSVRMRRKAVLLRKERKKYMRDTRPLCARDGGQSKT